MIAMAKSARAGACFCLCLWLALPCASAAGGSAAEPEWSRGEVARLESAYRAGLAVAATPGEVYECLRVRNAGLMALVESAYASTLALLAERGDLTDALQADQKRWLKELDMAELILGEALPRRIVAQELVSDMLIERLRVFDAVAKPVASGDPIMIPAQGSIRSGIIGILE